MDKQRLHTVRQDALDLLCRLIETPSFSREEAATASLIGDFLAERGVPVEIQGNNVLARTRVYDPAKATWLLNSHHDTVKPAAGYTRDPFKASIEAGKIFGLGSNDAGGALCALIAAFLYFYDEPGTPFNLVLAATAEEEVSGAGGIESVLPALGKIDGALVGEPTKMELAVAERGLLVIDAEAAGVAGHAARGEGVNALYAALDDIGILRKHRFGKISPLLGPVTAQATAIETGNKAHNVVPDRCRFVIDVRVNECHTLEEVLGGLRSLLKSRLTPRSLRLRSSIIPDDHPLVRAGMSLGRKSYGSPTTSDKALMPFPALKTGPGDSARSHTPDEFIYLHELMDGVEGYIQLLMRSV